MRVDVERHARAFSYRLALDPDDRVEARRGFSDARAPFALRRREYRVELPPSFTDLHPDLHAAAIWLVVHPLVGSRLALPFGTTAAFARSVREFAGVEVANVDAALSPRAPGKQARPCLMFSGGMDSVAAAIVFPDGSDLVFLDRIPRATSTSALIDLARQRDACAAVAALGRHVHATADDHEFLFAPYPLWHSDMSLLSALYLADSLALSTLDTGDVLDALLFGGYHDGTVTAWRRRVHAPGEAAERPSPTSPVDLELLGLRKRSSIGGLSEVCTTAIVSRSPLRGKSFSCYYPSDGFFCMRCDKCFKKLLLRSIAEGEEVPAALFERFLAQPHLAAIFRRPYFDWHHVWFYVFQNLRCDHWFVRELQAQARRGPDLSFLAKRYPGLEAEMEPAYRDELLERIARYVPTMDAAEVRALESLEVPPLHAPELPATASAASTAFAAASADPATGRLEEALRRVLAPDRWPFAELEVAEVAAEPQRRRVVVVLRRRADGPAPGGAPLKLFVERAADCGHRPFARIGPLAVSYARETPLDLPWRRAALDGLVRHVSAALRGADPGE